MDYFSPDLTGANPDYSKSTTISLFQTNQVIEFGTAVFEDTIQMTLLSDAQSSIPPGQNGWAVRDSDVDWTQMGLMKGRDPSFNRRLVKSIVIVREILVDIPVRIAYQQLYPVQTSQSTSGGQVRFTPQTFLELLGDVSHLKGVIASNIGNAIVPNEITVRTLEIDQHMSNSANMIEDEVQLVNVFDHQSIIAPAYGAFFKSSLEVRDHASGALFVPDVDYVVIGCDLDRTANTSETSGVYRYVLILREYVGEVRFSYHAYGGTINHLDVKEIGNEVNNILQYLGNKSFLTEHTLSSSPLLRGYLNRLEEVEQRMRILLNNADYGSVTGNGVSVRRTITAVDTQLHWWNVAELYTAEAGIDPAVVVSDRMRFRAKLVHSDVMFDVAVSVNLRAERNPFTIECDIRQQDMGYDLMGASDAQYPVAPQFRVIYNDEDGSYLSGAYLQIGMPLIALEEILAIEDMSGKESCWKLLLGDDVIDTTPKDSNVPLPSGTHTWDLNNDDSVVYTKSLPTTDTMYRAFEGGNPLSNYPFSADQASLLPEYFRVEDIKTVRVVLSNNSTGEPILIDIPVTGIENGVSGRAMVSDTGDFLKVTIYNAVNGEPGVINIGSTDGEELPASLGLDLNYLLVAV